MRFLSFLLAVSLLGCGGDIVNGAIVQAPPSIASIDAPCRDQVFSAEVGDLAVVLWAHRLNYHWAMPYDEVVNSITGAEVCVIDQGPGHFCGSVEAVGCASGHGGWIWSGTYGDKGYTVSVIVHEIGHLIARANDLPTSWAHSEPIHKEIEPLVKQDAAALGWDLLP